MMNIDDYIKDNNIKIKYYRYSINNHKYVIEVVISDSVILCCKGIPNEISASKSLEYILNLVENKEYNINDQHKLEKIINEIKQENYDINNIENKLKNCYTYTSIQNEFHINDARYDNFEMIIKCIELINEYDLNRYKE